MKKYIGILCVGLLLSQPVMMAMQAGDKFSELQQSADGKSKEHRLIDENDPSLALPVKTDPLPDDLRESLMQNAPQELQEYFKRVFDYFSKKSLLRSYEQSGAHESQIEELKAAINNYGADLKFAFVFDGPPGIGKTSCAQAFAEKLGCAYKLYSSPDLSNKWKNSGVQNIKRVIEKHEQEGVPCVICFDEIDQFFPRNKDQQDLDIGKEGQLRTMIDRVNKMKNVIVIMTCNEKNRISITTWERAKYISFSNPTKSQRQNIISYRVKKHNFITNLGLPVSADQIENLAEATSGYSCREIDDLFEYSLGQAHLQSISDGSLAQAEWSKTKQGLDYIRKNWWRKFFCSMSERGDRFKPYIIPTLGILVAAGFGYLNYSNANYWQEKALEQQAQQATESLAQQALHHAKSMEVAETSAWWAKIGCIGGIGSGIVATIIVILQFASKTAEKSAQNAPKVIEILIKNAK